MKKISRRDFLKSAAAGAVGVAAMGVMSAAGAEEQAVYAPLESIPSFMVPPTVPEAVVQEYDCDVLVIGTGMAGTPAVLAAAELGAKVIGIDKGTGIGFVPGTGDYGVIGSKVQEKIGITWESKGDVVNQLMKDMGYRPNPRLLGYWYDHSGPDFDWAIEGADYEILENSVAEPTQTNYIRPKLFPALDGYNWREEFYPYFHGSLTTNPSALWVLENVVEKAEALGASFIDNMKGEQLIQDESGRVIGAYAVDAEGNYHKFNTKNGVVVSCGDISGNKEMLQHYCPEAMEFFCYYGRFDAEGPCNSGDGHRMALFAGAAMEPTPFAPMTHHSGGPVGLDAFLQLNAYGERFMNEDVPGQTLQNQLSRQPFGFSWQILDDKWREQLACQGAGHGFVNYWLNEEEAAAMPWVFEAPFMAYVSDETFFNGCPSAMLSAVGVVADTLEELAEKMELPVETVLSEIARYNELAHKGADEDFGKVATRLFPIETPPFYATKFKRTAMLVCPGGIKVDLDLHALDANDEPIPGLYMAGNSMGGRFAEEYPVTVAGISLSSALTFGRLAGINAAKEI